MDYHYEDNVNVKLVRRRWLRTLGGAIAVTVLFAGAYIIYDALRAETEITVESTNSVQTLGETVERVVFDERLFYFEADVSWEEVDPPAEYNPDNTFLYINRDENGQSLQLLTVFVDDIPAEFAVNYVLPVDLNGAMIEPAAISPKCNTLLRDPLSRRDETATWFGVNFLCDPDGSTQIVGTAHNADGYGLRIPGTNAVHRYFFVFEDVQPTPRFSTFSNLLRTFRTK